MPVVSVVIPTYNRKRYIAQTVESVLAQTYRDFETIVVDDGSTDGTAHMLASQFGNRIRLQRLPRNQGRSAARNLGWTLARGEFVAFATWTGRPAAAAASGAVSANGAAALAPVSALVAGGADAATPNRAALQRAVENGKEAADHDDKDEDDLPARKMKHSRFLRPSGAGVRRLKSRKA